MSMWLLFAAGCLAIYPPAAGSAHTVTSVHPACELWLWTLGSTSFDAARSWEGVTARPGRTAPMTRISHDGTQLTLEHGSTALPTSRTVHEQRNSSDVYLLWPNSSHELSIDTAHVKNRGILQLLQDYDFVVDGVIKKRWVLLREGDDVSDVVTRFILSSAPTVGAAELDSFRGAITASHMSRLQGNAEMLRNMRRAVAESVEVQGGVHIVAGETTEKLSTVDGTWWLHCSVNILDLTHAEGFRRITGGEVGINTIMTEHVWEHLSLSEAIVAASNCFDALSPGGFLRIAVPDYNRALYHDSGRSILLSQDSERLPDSERMDVLRSSGVLSKDIEDEHLLHWSVCSLTEVLVAAGFQRSDISPVEYTDSFGSTVISNWKYSDGPIERSSKGTLGRPSSLIIDAKKPIHHTLLPHPVTIAIDCSKSSLALGVLDSFSSLVALLSLKLNEKFGPSHSLIVVMSSDNKDVESLRGSIKKINNKRLSIEYISDSENSSGLSTSKRAFLIRRQVTHLITHDPYYESFQAWRSLLNIEYSLKVITIHAFASTRFSGDYACRVPYISSAGTCSNTRFGINASHFGSSIPEEKISGIRKYIAASADAAGRTSYLVHKILGNPYVIIDLTKAHCAIVSSIGSDHEFRTRKTSTDSASHEVLEMFLGIVDGIAEGSSTMPSDARPWVILLGNCDWSGNYIGRKLSIIDWIGFSTESLNSEMRRTLIAGAISFISLPVVPESVAPMDHTLLHLQYPVLEALALGCPVIVGPPVDIDSYIAEPQDSDVDIQTIEYYKGFFDNSIMYVRRIEPISVWWALRTLISNSRFGKLNLEESVRRRHDISWRIRDHFMGWNNFATTIVERIGA